jgi:hypothetical protein
MESLTDTVEHLHTMNDCFAGADRGRQAPGRRGSLSRWLSRLHNPFELELPVDCTMLRA